MKSLVCMFLVATVASAAAPLMLSAQEPEPLAELVVPTSTGSISGRRSTLVNDEIEVRCTASLLPPETGVDGTTVRTLAVSVNFLAGRTLLGHVQTLRVVSGTELIEFDLRGMDLGLDLDPHLARRSIRGSVSPREGLTWLDVERVSDDLNVVAARVLD